MRTYVDQLARQYGMTRAQWSVLARVERSEGLKQSELAEMLDLQPITLTRLIDRLCDSGMIERRADPNDRRAKRLFLKPAARPLLDRLWVLADDFLPKILAGIDAPAVERMVGELGGMKDNLRHMISQRDGGETALDIGHG
ncbi:MAG TPA: MarR family transcriptional regulator [Xanthobacteraceae bacterium]